MRLIRFSGPQQIESVMDARSKFKWDLGHHPDAVHVPLGEINEEQILGAFDSPLLTPAFPRLDKNVGLGGRSLPRER